jgi:KaiC/GvpD/RAD55 family RecA-like ATPase
MKKRVKSGIYGLDPLIEGGFLPGSVTLVTGKTGTGKTIFCCQFLYKGAVEYKEPGIYITTEEMAEDIKNDVLISFGWDFEKLEKKNKLRIIEVDPANIRVLPTIINENVLKIKARRAVIDSTSLFELCFKDVYETRRKIFECIKALKKMGLTTLLTAEVLEESKGLSRFGVVEFMVDGIILLQFIGLATRYKRMLCVRKMRRTEHSIRIHPFKITKDGIKVFRVKAGT